jgi:Hemerythrin HHE cation binding domain
MLSALENRPRRAASASEAVLAARTQVAQWLVIDSSRREAAEEQYFWSAVRKHITNGDQLADEAISQESEKKEVLDKLNKLEASDAEFDELFLRFIPAARQHIEFEEGQVWPKLCALLTTDQATELGAQVSKAKEHGPTRPHQHTPANPALLKTAGSAVAAIDQFRDVLTGARQDEVSAGRRGLAIAR